MGQSGLFFTVLLLAAGLCQRGLAKPRFSNVFQSSMVLQRGQSIKVWGFDAAAGTDVIVALGPPETVPLLHGRGTSRPNGTWEVVLPPAPPAAIGLSMYLILVEQGSPEPAQTLEDVTVGDVYLFAGQSNVDLPEAYAHQFDAAAQEQEERFAANMGHAGLLRIMIVPNQVPGVDYKTVTPAAELTDAADCQLCAPPFRQEDGHYQYCQCNALNWARANATNVRGFSALGWFTASAIWHSRPNLRGVPLGLIRSSKGGTKIMKWSPQSAVATCSRRRRRYLASSLYANMIHPFAGLHFSAVIWMHGASDTGTNADDRGPQYYACALPALIRSWRDTLGQQLPFIVVELPAYCNELDWRTFRTWCDQNSSRLQSVDYHLPRMRLSQHAAEELSSVYIVTAMDFGSLHPFKGSIHSDKKKELGKRLSIAIFSAVYNDSRALWQGPRVVSAQQLSPDHVHVQFDAADGLVLDAAAKCPPAVLPVYCTGAGFELQGQTGLWTSVATVALATQNSVVLKAATNMSGEQVQRVRYAFADWPVCSLRGRADGIPARIFDIDVKPGDISSLRKSDKKQLHREGNADTRNVKPGGISNPRKSDKKQVHREGNADKRNKTSTSNGTNLTLIHTPEISEDFMQSPSVTERLNWE